ncbi:MAG: phage regulatory protein/antirepressor Ant [Turicibacter sp.]|nr:phage regulatory protein/antirepressor Ant [Turicibacter sp.]
MCNLITFEGQVVVSSRVVAEDFGKRHNHVMDAIREKLTTENSVVKNWFIESEFEHRGNTYTEYLMTRDGFSFLVMGFNGREADEFKIKYIEAFNRMEARLRTTIVPLDSYMIDDPVQRAERWIEEKKICLAYEAKALRHDEIYNSPALKTTTDIAKDLGINATQLNKILNRKGIIFKKSGTWYPYAKYEHLIANGYCDYEINERGQILKWTEKGRVFIMDAVKGQMELGLLGGLFK